MMIVRDPLVCATYFYLRYGQNETVDRNQERHAEFVDETHRMLSALAGWLALPVPEAPAPAAWPRLQNPLEPQPLMAAQTMQGRTNASAVLRAYALRNMLLLRVIIARGGEHEQTVWEMLDEALGAAPTAQSWLQTTRYWCAIAPRPPEDLEYARTQPIHAPFGVLCLGHGPHAHLLVYPDARTENRATGFLATLAPRLDWFPVQARYRLDAYAQRVSGSARVQRQALEHVTQSAQTWERPAQHGMLHTLSSLHNELDALEALHRTVVDDLAATYSDMRELRTLATEYRLELIQCGLWNAAPTVWQAEVTTVATMEAQIDADVQHINATLRRIEFLFHGIQARAAIQQGERTQLFAYLAALLGVAIVVLLIADSNLERVAIWLLVLALVVAVGSSVWWFGQRRRARREHDRDH